MEDLKISAKECYVEALFNMLDTNKMLRFNSTSEKQRKQLDNGNKKIMKMLKKIKIGSLIKED